MPMEMYLRREFFRTIQLFNSFTSYWCCKLFCISTDMQSQNNDSILDVTMEGYLLKHIWKKSMLNFFHSSAVNPSKALSILVGSFPRSLDTIRSWISLKWWGSSILFSSQIFIRCMAVPAMQITKISKKIPKKQESMSQINITDITKNLDIIWNIGWQGRLGSLQKNTFEHDLLTRHWSNNRI